MSDKTTTLYILGPVLGYRCGDTISVSASEGKQILKDYGGAAGMVLEIHDAVQGVASNPVEEAKDDAKHD